ncbi:MAG: GUN4 domain-containing protein [Tolypothrix carrinoi HA7290-LM1]|jgi:hypothetical protein|nr:GUN4 domain-containing protein [Tolypothrix carrinoi HA7290-LM1]
MAKYALLIGISEYQSKPLKPLPGVVKDIEAMQRVLQDSKTGGFDEVKLLTNPDSDAMRSEIEQLFMEKCQTDDIVLLYFSGHGYRDEDGNLFFVSHNTQINPQGGLRIGTAVDAKFIHERYMGRSKSKRQVLILDCCFSGAFAEGMSAKEAVVVSIKNEIEAQLGGEGRAVLTSSTAAQVSFEDAGGGVYTRYLVEGIEKGAADSDNDGVITIDELHEYAKRKAQESKPAMKPEIYAVQEGYKIRLANAPLSSELGYRKEVEECVKNGAFSVENNSFSNLGRKHLNRKQTDFKLNSEQAAKIEEEVLQPIREFQQSLQEYEETLTEALKDEAVLSDGSWEILKRYQQTLKLRDEDVAPIHDRLIPEQPISTIDTPQQPTLTPEPQQTVSDEDDLSSEKGIDYTKLRDLLKTGNWKEADYETYLVMIQAVGKKENDYFERDDLLNFPCTDLRTIDRLWVKYSDGRFGFTVQKQIYISIGGKDDGQYYEEAWELLGDRVGWKVDNNWIDSLNNINFDTSAPEGHLPFWGAGEKAVLFFSSVVSRIETCKL